MRFQPSRSRIAIGIAAFTMIAVLATVVFESTPVAQASPSSITVFAVPSPTESIGNATDAGAITLLSLGSNGSAVGTTSVFQGSKGVRALNEAGDQFGSALAWGDVNGDGISDLIVGSPKEDIGTIRNAGAITVLYGAADGKVNSSAVFHQGSANVVGINEPFDAWGTSIASGDLNGDGYDDVLIGAPFEDIGRAVNTGAVTVMYGSARGLSGTRSELLHQAGANVPGKGESGDGFGMSVAVAGARSGTSTYVAIGSPWEDVDGRVDAGAVTLLSTDRTGIGSRGQMLFAGAPRVGDRPSIPEELRHQDRFGYRLAGGRDGTLAIGAPYARVLGRDEAGYVVLFNDFYRDASAWVRYQGEGFEIAGGNLFGAALDIEIIGSQTVVVAGAPGDSVLGNDNAGSVVVMPLNGSSGTIVTQGDGNVPGTAESGDRFGSHVDVLPTGAIFASAPGEELGDGLNGGAGVVLFGGASNPGSSGAHVVHQDFAGVPGVTEAGDAWGLIPTVAMPAPSTPDPTPTPRPQPTATPRPQPTATPRPQPTPTPRPQPTATPRPQPTPTPRPQPTPTPRPQPTATPAPGPVGSQSEIAPRNGTHLGANVSNDGFENRYEGVKAFERGLGRQLSIVNRFHEFSAGLESSFFFDRQHIEDGRTLMMSWRATDNAGTFNGEPDPDRARKIANGQFDTEIRAMANAMKDLEAPLLLRFNWEMDQDVGDNQYIGPPEQFIAAWRHTHDLFEQVGADNVEWVWSPRAASFNKDIGPLYYPGDSYVDWVGGSAVPINSFRDPVTIYGAWNEWASSRNFPKPQLLWMGLRENPDDPTWKGDFFDDLQGLLSGPWTNVKAFVYYNSGSPLGFNYRISTSTRATREFTELACSAHFETNFSC